MATRPVAVVSDAAHPTCMVRCSVHGMRPAYISTGSSLTKISGRFIAREGDLVVADCTATGYIQAITCSSFMTDEGKKVALVDLNPAILGAIISPLPSGHRIISGAPGYSRIEKSATAYGETDFVFDVE
jgi:uncharacterized Zn-binding protein involved in type VI secretion